METLENVMETLDKDFSWFASNPNILNNDYADKVKPFYERAGKPFYNLSLDYNTMTKDSKFRFLLIDEGEDKVFAPYKVIQLMKTKQIRFFGFPISEISNKANEQKVFDALKKLPFVKFVFSEKISGASRQTEYDDYFYELDNPKFATSRYRSKNYINKLLANPDVQIAFTQAPYNAAFQELRKAWKEGMEARGSKVSPVSDRCFTNIINSRNKNLRFISVFYKGKLLSLQVFLLKEAYADLLYIHHLWKGEEKRILSNIVEIQKYLSWKFLFEQGVERVYLAGCRPTEHRLLKHKQRTCDGRIEYYLL